MNYIIYKDRTNANSRKFSGILDKFGRDDLIPLWIAEELKRTLDICRKHHVYVQRYVDYTDSSNKDI